jgi:hypothetical protein
MKKTSYCMVHDELKKPGGVLNPQRLSGPNCRPPRKNGFFAVFVGTGGIASRAAPEATPRPPSGHLVANR